MKNFLVALHIMFTVLLALEAYSQRERVESLFKTMQKMQDAHTSVDRKIIETIEKFHK